MLQLPALHREPAQQGQVGGDGAARTRRRLWHYGDHQVREVWREVVGWSGS